MIGEELAGKTIADPIVGECTYNENGDLIYYKDAHGIEQRREYDPNGELKRVEVRHADGTVYYSMYDNFAKSTYPPKDQNELAGQKIPDEYGNIITYDDKGRAVHIVGYSFIMWIEYKGTGKSEYKTVTTEYIGEGRITSIFYPNGKVKSCCFSVGGITHYLEYNKKQVLIKETVVKMEYDKYAL